MRYITLLDYLLLPIYVVIIYLIAINFRDKNYPPGHPWRPYFMPGFTAKILGAIFISLIYQYYYGGGDTEHFFKHAVVINSALKESIWKWIQLILHVPKWYDGDYSFYISQMFWYKSPAEYGVGVIAALFGILTFTTYLPTAVIFGAVSFTGVWALFRCFASQYPAYVKIIAITVLFTPSVVLWGSGLFKDTICIGGIGWLTYGVFRMLILRDLSLRNIVITLVSFYLVFVIKIYILLAFLPALTLWILFNYLHKIRSKAARFIIRIGVVAMAVVGFLFISRKLADTLGKYSLDNLAKTTMATKGWIQQQTNEGEGSLGYDLGEFEPTFGGMLKKFPAAVNVTLFRPYIWETRKVFQLLTAIEALVFLLLTIKLLLYLGPIKVWRAIATDPNIQFCLIFTLIFAFAVGMSSFNFGALSRYRIPCLPFYGMALVLIFYKYNPPDKSIFSLKR